MARLDSNQGRTDYEASSEAERNGQKHENVQAVSVCPRAPPCPRSTRRSRWTRWACWALLPGWAPIARWTLRAPPELRKDTRGDASNRNPKCGEAEDYLTHDEPSACIAMRDDVPEACGRQRCNREVDGI